MKLKASEIVLIIAAVAIVGLLGYNLMNNTDGETEKTVEKTTERANRSTEAGSTSQDFSEDPETLRQQLQRADKDEVIRFMRYVLDKKLPENYEFPDFLLEAGSAKESVKVIGERYPEFYQKGGTALVDAVRQYPVKYIAMIEESRAYRELYRPTSEIEAEEQARKAEAMRKELARQKAAEEAAAETEE